MSAVNAAPRVSRQGRRQALGTGRRWAAALHAANAPQTAGHNLRECKTKHYGQWNYLPSAKFLNVSIYFVYHIVMTGRSMHIYVLKMPLVMTTVIT